MKDKDVNESNIEAGEISREQQEHKIREQKARQELENMRQEKIRTENKQLRLEKAEMETQLEEQVGIITLPSIVVNDAFICKTVIFKLKKIQKINQISCDVRFIIDVPPVTSKILERLTETSLCVFVHFTHSWSCSLSTVMICLINLAITYTVSLHFFFQLPTKILDRPQVFSLGGMYLYTKFSKRKKKKVKPFKLLFGRILYLNFYLKLSAFHQQQL